MEWKQGGTGVFSFVPSDPNEGGATAPKTSDDPLKGETKAEPSLPQQLKRAAVILPLLGLCWLILQGPPDLGFFQSEREGGEGVEKKLDATGAVGEVERDEEDTSPSLEQGQAAASSLAYFRDQIVAQLGGEDVVEVRHLALSDDGESLVAALKQLDSEEGGRLFELLFERDRFGRFLSVSETGLDSPVLLWHESSIVSGD
ncbi:MAG: hypothetical protein AAGC68_10325 [Verrucomicrobiota bacterium]